MSRRKPSSTKAFRKSHDKGRYCVTVQANSTDSSPEIARQKSIDLVDTFGSVATVRGRTYIGVSLKGDNRKIKQARVVSLRWH